MIRTILAGSAVAAALLFAAQPVKADWLCGPVQCVWVTYHVVNVPDYAVTWTAPVAPNCYWKRGFFGRWKLICP
ncbi:MAG: hypothetical protein ACRD9W_22775 [Terriglobia bacterium]